MPLVSASRHVTGSGIVGTVDGRDVVIGKPRFVTSFLGREHTEQPRDDGPSEVWIAVDGVLVGRAMFGDAIRRDARASIDALRRAGWRVQIASGDAQHVVDAVARETGIDASHAVGDASPEEKLAIVQRASAAGRVVMVGDGVNDAAAIAAASVGVGVHGGAEASLAAADVYLARTGLAPLVELVQGARRTMSVIRLGIFISLVYNVVGVALAVFGLINPLVAAVMMPTSSLTVLLVAWRGRTFQEGTT
jgi:Cu2+-exporting ATPase